MRVPVSTLRDTLKAQLEIAHAQVERIKASHDSLLATLKKSEAHTTASYYAIAAASKILDNEKSWLG